MAKNKDLKILLTGGSGFLGRWLAQRLMDDAGTVLTPPHDTLDLLKPGATDYYISGFKPDVLVHLAATVGGIEANRREPGRFFYENMMMGMNVLESARLANVKKVVMIGTICAYPKFTPVPFKEEELWNGFPEETNAPYGVAKRALLTMGQAYRKQYGMNIIYLMPVNLYGPGDHDNLTTSHVIPALIRKFIEAKRSHADTVTVWGTGKPTREFLFVRDAADAIAQATQKYDGEDPVNLGSCNEITIWNLANLIATLVGFAGNIVFDTTKPDGQPRRCLDTTRAEKYFGWKATTSLVDGLKETIEFMSNTTTLPHA